MQYCFKIATVNLNSTSTDVNRGLLKDFILDHDIDIAFLQEVTYDNFLFLPTHYSLVNISQDNKGTAVLVRKTFGFSNPLLDPNGRIISVVVNSINFVNIYAHSGTSYRRERNDLFTNHLAVHLNKPGIRCSVVGGDFNCVLDFSDSRGPSKNQCAGLKNVVDLFSLKDIAKELNKKEFTFFRNASASRLDRFYASTDFVKDVLNIDTIPISFSDHHAVIMKVKSTKEEIPSKGRGYWKINPCILESEEVKIRFEHEYNLLKQRPIYTSDLNNWWHFVLKPKIRQFYKSESWKLNSEIQRQKGMYLTRLLELADQQARGSQVSSEITHIKSKLMEIEYDRLQNFSKKLPDCSISESEKMSVYQISNQIHRGSESQHLRLSGPNGLTSDRNHL